MPSMTGSCVGRSFGVNSLGAVRGGRMRASQAVAALLLFAAAALAQRFGFRRDEGPRPAFPLSFLKKKIEPARSGIAIQFHAASLSLVFYTTRCKP